MPAEPQPGREQQSWLCLVFFLCFYGFMAQMRPGESFITPYLLGPDKNFTQTQARWARMRVGRAGAQGLHGCRHWQPPVPVGWWQFWWRGCARRGPLGQSPGASSACPPICGALASSRGLFAEGITEGICLLLSNKDKGSHWNLTNNLIPHGSLASE